MKTKQHLKKLFCIGIVLTLAGSIFASLFNSGMGSVKVSRIRFDGGHGELSGLLYMPKDVSEDNPAPTIIVTHGYLNSCEMQDANAIELHTLDVALRLNRHGLEEFLNAFRWENLQDAICCLIVQR